MIDLDATNPDWQLASLHSQATMAGKTYQPLSDIQRCPCCFRAIQLQPIGLCKNSKETDVLGYAYPLFFKFLQLSLMLIFFQICSYNVVELYNGIKYNQNYCGSLKEPEFEGPICNDFLVEIASLDPKVTDQELIIRVGSFTIQLAMLLFIRNRLTKNMSYYRERETTLSDYSVLIKELPKVPGIKKKVKKLFDQFFYVPVKIEEMVLIGDLTNYYTLKHEKEGLLVRRRKLLKKRKRDEGKLKQVEQKLVAVRSELQNQIEKVVTLTKKDELFCEKVIVVLQSDPMKQTVINEWQKFLKRDDKKQQLQNIFGSDLIENIRIDQAPEPQEIIWNHINTPRSTKRVRFALGWFFTFLFMAAITGIFYLVIKEKSFIVEHEVETLHQERQHGQAADDHGLKAQIYLLVYFFIFFVVLLNKFAISLFLHWISDFERHATYSKQEYYFSIKYTITLFLTTAVMTLLVEGATFKNVFNYEFGIVEEESIMFMINAFFIPFLWLVNPLQLFRILRRKYREGKEEYTQREANQTMKNEPAALGKHFSQTIQIIWFTFMYSSVIPAGAIVILAGLSINYWVVKYTILRRSSVDHQLSGTFILPALKLLDISLIMKPAGQLIFDQSIRQNYAVESIVLLIIGFLYCLLPVGWIQSKTHRQEFNLQEKTYNEVKDRFVISYHMMHPIYSLQKIFVEKEMEKLNIYQPVQKDKNHLLKISNGIDAALRRRSSMNTIRGIQMIDMEMGLNGDIQGPEIKVNLIG